MVSLAVDEVYEKKTFPSVYPSTTRIPRPRPQKPSSVPNQPYKLRIPLPEPDAWPDAWPTVPAFPPQGPSRFSESAGKVKMVIEAANRERERAEEIAAMYAAEEAMKKEVNKSKMARSKEMKEKKKKWEVLKEKRMTKLVGQVVVKCMSSHAKSMDHDTFKNYAKEVRIIRRAMGTMLMCSM